MVKTNRFYIYSLRLPRDGIRAKRKMLLKDRLSQYHSWIGDEMKEASSLEHRIHEEEVPVFVLC